MSKVHVRGEGERVLCDECGRIVPLLGIWHEEDGKALCTACFWSDEGYGEGRWPALSSLSM